MRRLGYGVPNDELSLNDGDGITKNLCDREMVKTLELAYGYSRVGHRCPTRLYPYAK